MDDGAAQAVAEVDGVLAQAYEAATTARAGDVNIACAVLNRNRAVEVANESGGIGACGVDGAADGEVTEDGRVGPGGSTKRGNEVLAAAVVEGQRMAAAVERAAEGGAVAAARLSCHAAHADVGASPSFPAGRS